MKKHEYKNNKQDYDEIYFPLAEKAAEIREKGANASSEEKDLAKVDKILISNRIIIFCRNDKISWDLKN